MPADLITNASRPNPSDSARRSGVLVKMWRRRSVFVQVFCAIFVLAVAALMVLPVYYLAIGSVIVAEQEPGIANASAAWAQKIGDPADLESQLLVIRSPRVIRLAAAEPETIEMVLRECRYNAESGGLNSLLAKMNAPCEKIRSDGDALIDYLQTRYVVGSVGRSRVINISYKSMLPEVAQSMVNVLITAFLEDQRTNLSKGREVASAWLWEELRRLDAEFHEEDEKIQAYRSTKGLMRGATAPITSERLTSTSQQLSAAEAARAEAAARLQEIKADQSRGSSDASAVLASRAIADLKQQISAVTAQLVATSTVLGSRHPTQRALQRELEGLHTRFATEVTSIAANAEKSYAAADALVTSLRRQMELAKAEVATASTDEAAIESMVRSVDIKRTQYSELHKRASELETERRVLLGSTRLVSLAEIPNKPFFPKRLPFLLAGFTIALLGAMIATVLRDRSDRSVRASSELALAAGIPTLARLRHLGKDGTSFAGGFFAKRDADMPLQLALEAAQDDEVFQDALRKLYTSVVFATGNRKCRAVLVASPGAREGKTFLTLALARFAAASGRRVLVVDCDTRRPAIDAAHDLGNNCGLMDVLRGTAAPRDALAKRVIPNLDVLPAGRSGAEPIELLVGNRLPEFLRWAQAYDLVLFDSAPLNSMMDACTLAKYVDGVLCCARWGQSSIGDTVATIEGLRSAGGHVLGMVITMLKPDEYALYEPAVSSVTPVVYLKAS